MDAVELFWRPGCLHCRLLRRYLRRHHVPLDERNIWTDPQAAAVVRSVTGGQETVPTVRIGGRAMVNPPGRKVLAVLATDAPHLLPDGYGPPRPGRLVRFVLRVLRVLGRS